MRTGKSLVIFIFQAQKKLSSEVKCHAGYNIALLIIDILFTLVILHGFRKVSLDIFFYIYI